MVRKLSIGLIALVLSACGAVATPEWQVTIEAESDETLVADAATSEVMTESAPTATSTPSLTPTLEPTLAPTETSVPPTATATDAPTEIPPTEEVVETEEPVAETEEAVDADEVEAEPPADDPITQLIAESDLENGQRVFNEMYSVGGGQWMCASCHSVDESGMRLIGPGLWNLYERADERAADAGDPDGLTYVANSIYLPNDYIVPADEVGPYPENLMPANYEEIFSEEEFRDLQAYILSLGNPNA